MLLGQIGRPALDDKPYYAFVEFETVRAEQLNGIREIAASHYDIMVVKNNGGVYFLHSDAKKFSSPILTLGLGQGHFLAIDETGRIWGWGYNTYGQLGEGIDAAVNKPVLLKGRMNQFSGGQAYEESVTMVGYEYEQQFTDDVNIVPPKINDVHVEVLNKGEGIYKLSLRASDYTYDSTADNQEPFFWQTNDGTFWEYASDYSWVVFKSNPDAIGEMVKVAVGIGDGRGYSDKRCVVLEGKK